MRTTFLPESNEKSTGERFANAIHGGLGAANQVYQQYKQEAAQQQQAKLAEQKLSQENAAIKKATGQDISGITDPKMRQQFMQEVMRTKGKEELFGKKQDFMNRLLSPEQGAEEGVQGKPAGLDEISDESILKATVVDPNIGRALSEAKNRKSAAQSKDRDYNYKRAKPVLEKAEKIRESSPIVKASLNSMEDAISEGNMDYFSLNNLAEKTGIGAFGDADLGKFKAASKNFLVSNVAKFGARPNMYIEQQVAEMLPKVGKTREGNLSALEMLRFEADINDEFAKTVDALEDLDVAKNGYPSATIGKEADRVMKAYVERRQDELAARLKQLREEEKSKVNSAKKSSIGGFVKMVNPETGEAWEIPRGNVEQALHAGWMQQ